LTRAVDVEGMESTHKPALSLVPALEHPKVDVEVELAPEPVRLTGEAAKRAERANLLALEAAIEASSC
jgi:hypothetical protein